MFLCALLCSVHFCDILSLYFLFVFYLFLVTFCSFLLHPLLTSFLTCPLFFSVLFCYIFKSSLFCSLMFPYSLVCYPLLPCVVIFCSFLLYPPYIPLFVLLNSAPLFFIVLCFVMFFSNTPSTHLFSYFLSYALLLCYICLYTSPLFISAILYSVLFFALRCTLSCSSLFFLLCCFLFYN